ncbi:MAG: LysE family translocator [Paraglaciecola sp.]|uniref:LysE family translocator n=1 Tax=Paraglaciecola sp. TaxID=1920173 RepID=UPI00273E9317|nr:LysE family translocator [Paraglaciecola sp.]MDP5030600.1 LysE family translocator [Paraglaciecola sp.]MDP5129677.1 LysE family translocator [Paraglaciecola sp.]
MPDWSILAVFIPTFFFVSITPGLCMTLAMTLGMSVGMRRTLWMMLGEVVGVALVAIAAVMGVATLMLNFPQIFTLFKWAGGGYLAYVGVMMWRAKAQPITNEYMHKPPSNLALVSQGFITAIANPKGWAFMISLLPPFLSLDKPISIQLGVFVGIIMCSEFLCMTAYASGGKSLRLFLNRGDNIRWLNRIAGALLIGVGLWLIAG